MYMSSLLFVHSATGGWGQRSAGEPQQVVGSARRRTRWPLLWSNAATFWSLWAASRWHSGWLPSNVSTQTLYQRSPLRWWLITDVIQTHGVPLAYGSVYLLSLRKCSGNMEDQQRAGWWWQSTRSTRSSTTDHKLVRTKRWARKRKRPWGSWVL